MKTRPLSEKTKALRYIETLMDVAREPFLILDKKLRVVSANESFYHTFRVIRKRTEGKFIYNLGNKQWNIPELKGLLEKILPQKKVIRGFEVKHKFPKIGVRVMCLNAHQIDSIQLIILAFEDITEKKKAEQKALDYTKDLEKKVAATLVANTLYKEREAFYPPKKKRKYHQTEKDSGD